MMDLSNNKFKDITFHIYNETTPSNDRVFLPSLEEM